MSRLREKCLLPSITFFFSRISVKKREFKIVCPNRSRSDFKVMVPSSSSWASQINISGIIHIRKTMNYLVKLNQAKIFSSELQC